MDNFWQVLQVACYVSVTNWVQHYPKNKTPLKTAVSKGVCVVRDGIEPPTQGFSVPCSTI